MVGSRTKVAFLQESNAWYVNGAAPKVARAHGEQKTQIRQSNTTRAPHETEGACDSWGAAQGGARATAARVGAAVARKGPSRFLLLEHDFAQGLGHQASVYGAAVELALENHATLLHSSLLAEGMSHGDHSDLGAPAQGAALEGWLGLSHTMPSLQQLLGYYAKQPEGLVVLDLNRPCRNHTRFNGRFTDSRSLRREKLNQRLLALFEEGERRLSAQPPAAGTGADHGAVLVRGCGSAISLKDGIEAAWWWQAKAAAAAAQLAAEEATSGSWEKRGLCNQALDLPLFASASGARSTSRVVNVAVHVRRGDFLLPKHRKRLTSDEHFVVWMCNCLSIVSAYSGQDSQRPRVRFHVFSESSIAAADAHSNHSSRVADLPPVGRGVYVNQSGYPGDLEAQLRAMKCGQAGHASWRLHYWIDTPPVEALMHMSAADVLIPSRSGFSAFAAWLSMAGIVVLPPKQIAHPFQLVNSRHLVRDYCAFQALWLRREECRAKCIPAATRAAAGPCMRRADPSGAHRNRSAVAAAARPRSRTARRHLRAPESLM